MTMVVKPAQHPDTQTEKKEEGNVNATSFHSLMKLSITLEKT